MTTSARAKGRPSRRGVSDQFAASMVDLARYGGLPALDQARPLWDDLWHLDVHHSTAIEGNTLVFREVESLLETGRAVGAKNLKDYLEVLGYADAAAWVYRQAGPARHSEHDQIVTMTEIRELHRLTMGRVWNVAPHPAANPGESPGSFREHEIAVFPGAMKPPTFPLVPAMLDAWVDRVNQVGGGLRDNRIDWAEGPRIVAACHAEFERIHPFLDGNGRTGRLLLNLIMARIGWPPVVILTSQRRRYLGALASADAGDVGSLAEMIARAAIASMNMLLPSIAGADTLVPLSALADDAMSLPALRQAAIRGRLEARLDQHGQWRSSREAVEAYKTGRYGRHGSGPA
ncbi:MAG: Fic family protein [Actinomycetia bacterium]|nr:Fic family protein [Actinomycetes bacterium]